MQSVDMTALKELERDLEYILREIKGAKRDLHDRVGAAVLEEVRRNIDASGINDANGHIKGYQTSVTGSGGGYAAVRAVRGLGQHGSSDSPGAVTNYLEGGHQIRKPSGKAKRRRKGRIKKAYVDGFHFYGSTESSAEQIAISEAERFADEITARLEE